MSENMMNANRPVMCADIAAKLGVPLNSVRGYLAPNSQIQSKKAKLIRQTAEQMGYDPQLAQRYGKGVNQRKETEYPEKECVKCHTIFLPTSGNQKYCFACAKETKKERVYAWRKAHPVTPTSYWNGNFKTKAEEVARMEELRARGYSNAEIAKAIGRSYFTVLCAIGKQDHELSKQNVAMGAHIRAQKNAARKQYVINKPIREYNAKVEEHNALKAKVAQMEAELKPQTPVVEKVAQIKIDFPLIDLHTVQPTALQ